MVVIGVLSDTHLHNPDDWLMSLFKPGHPLFECNMLIHAGDFTSINILNALESQGLVYGVQGNMDDYALRERLSPKKVIRIEGVKIGITHGWGAPYGLARRVYDFFNDPTLNCIVFGHSHVSEKTTLGHTLMFNPGSFRSHHLTRKRSVGKLFVEGKNIWGEIVPL